MWGGDLGPVVHLCACVKMSGLLSVHWGQVDWTDLQVVVSGTDCGVGDRMDLSWWLYVPVEIDAFGEE